ncbi:hypothetical protein ACIRPK_01030 [Kitasatospora sp. NPDC101801]|uniref:hypothetical protein n=1 Tax=Kitasatospora sp. NPDC101801 TaxID=3364103 RepID=UPI00381BE49A
MRSECALLAGAATAAILVLGAPTAQAETVPGATNGQTTQQQPRAVDDQKVWQEAPAAPVVPAAPAAPAAPEGKKAATDQPPAAEKKPDHEAANDKAAAEPESSWQHRQKPHGGVHTGGGGLAVSGGGLASGAVLLAGGLGIGAYTLRRRTSGSGPA